MNTKIDNPPPYEDALHHPKYGNYPQLPEQGSSLPPPPSYSPSPGMCPGLPGYWGQEGVFPQAGMWAAPCFSPSGVPTTIPTLSAGVPASNTGSEGHQTAEDHIQHYMRLAPVCECNVYSAIPQETWRNTRSGEAHLFVMPLLER